MDKEALCDVWADFVESIWPKNSVLCLMGWVGAPVHSNKTQCFSFFTSKI